jgi:cytochrome c oxidase subunit 2
MISWWVPQVSTFAAEIDNLVLLIGVIVGAWFIAAELIFFWLIFKFRARDGVRAQYIAGETKREKRWVTGPHYAVLVFDVVILYFALQVWTDIKISGPANPATAEPVRIISQQWAWTFVHAGPDGKLDTDDDIRTVEDLNVQVGRTYTYELHSRDVLHSFSVPVFRLKQDAIPGRAIYGWFTPTHAGSFDIQCAEICGFGHGLMPGRVHIRAADDHRAWMTTATAAALATAVPARAPAADPALAPPAAHQAGSPGNHK